MTFIYFVPKRKEQQPDKPKDPTQIRNANYSFKYTSVFREPNGPTLRANPFSKGTDLICRIPLPTFFYTLEAIHLEDLLRLLVRSYVKINLYNSVPWSFMEHCRISDHITKLHSPLQETREINSRG